jgi:acetoin utilization deacetylase AcuC-like enzyme
MVMMKELKEASFFDQLTFVKPKPLPEELLYKVHSPRMIQQIKEISENSNTWLDLDTYVCKHDFETAMLAAGGLLYLCNDVINEKADNGFAIVRPPGHHATSSTSMGFCLFNNPALSAYALINKGYKVLIFDPDVHHGNGTQDIFYKTDQVLYQSFHLSPHFPGTGAIKEIGQGKGKGYNINVPLSRGNGERAVKKIMHELFLPIAEQFNPDFIIVSSGFDSHHSDRLGGLNLTVNYFGTLIKEMMDIQPKLVCTLEGGYNLDWIGKCLISQIGILCDEPVSFTDSVKEQYTAGPVIEQVKTKMKPYWDI